MNIYTDGAQSSSTLAGGWAIVITDKNNVFLNSQCAMVPNTTNNRMELQAVLAALRFIYYHTTEPSTIYTDSAYIANCFKDKWYEKWQVNGWKTAAKKPVLNKDLWEEILDLYSKLPSITIAKVAGHANNYYNELADKLAVEARKKDK